jgi:hypothetical protein
MDSQEEYVPPEQLSLIYTRYLYGKLEVKQSLLIALLDKHLDEALFWAYELYYSGFTDDVFSYVVNIYEEFYSIENPNLRKAIDNAHAKWVENAEESWHLGSIVTTLCYCNFQVNGFMEKYFGLKCAPTKASDNKTGLFIRFKQESLMKYETISNDGKMPRFYLERAYRFCIRKEVNQLFKTAWINNKNDYFNNWIYYAAKSPVWLERIDEHNGIIDHEKKTVVFEDADDLEAFYDAWGFEPDEQKAAVFEKSIGAGIEKQFSIREFCEKYGAEVLTKTLKVRQAS